MTNENNNDVVMIKLDVERELRFGHKALKMLSALTGMSMETMSDGDMDFGEMEKIIYCGLITDDQERLGGNLKLEDMEDLLDKCPKPKYYMDKMTQALSNAFGDGTEGNELPQPNREQRRAAAKQKPKNPTIGTNL